MQLFVFLDYPIFCIHKFLVVLWCVYLTHFEVQEICAVFLCDHLKQLQDDLREAYTTEVYLAKLIECQMHSLLIYFVHEKVDEQAEVDIFVD